MDKAAVTLNLIHKGIECEHKHDELETYDDLDSLAGTWSEEEATGLRWMRSYGDEGHAVGHQHVCGLQA